MVNGNEGSTIWGGGSCQGLHLALCSGITTGKFQVTGHIGCCGPNLTGLTQSEQVPYLEAQFNLNFKLWLELDRSEGHVLGSSDARVKGKRVGMHYPTVEFPLSSSQWGAVSGFAQK